MDDSAKEVTDLRDVAESIRNAADGIERHAQRDGAYSFWMQALVAEQREQAARIAGLAPKL